MTNYIFIYLNW